MRIAPPCDLDESQREVMIGVANLLDCVDMVACAPGGMWGGGAPGVTGAASAMFGPTSFRGGAGLSAADARRDSRDRARRCRPDVPLGVFGADWYDP